MPQLKACDQRIEKQPEVTSETTSSVFKAHKNLKIRHSIGWRNNLKKSKEEGALKELSLILYYMTSSLCHSNKKI